MSPTPDNRRKLHLVSDNGFNLNTFRKSREDLEYENEILREQNASLKKTNRNLRNSCKSMRTKFVGAKKALAVALIAAVAIGPASYVIGNNKAQSDLSGIEYNLDEYDYSTMSSDTENLLTRVAIDSYIEKHPLMEEELQNISSISFYEEYWDSNGNVTLRMKYDKYDHNTGETKTDVIRPINLPQDFGKDVYLNYREVKNLEENTPDEEKSSVKYMVEMNTAISNLQEGLSRYAKEGQNKDYAQSAQSIINSSRDNSLNATKTESEQTKSDDGDER